MMDFEIRYFDRKGVRISAEQWMTLLNDDDYRRVAVTEFEDGTRVSTVWLGLDHSMPTDPSIKIFETLVFDGSDESDGTGRRYSNLDEAKKGHQEFVRTVEEDVRNRLKRDVVRLLDLS